MDLEHAKRVGIQAAYSGAKALRDRFGHISQIGQKGAFDLVTEADTASEKIIIQTIRNAFPDHAILAEESGVNHGNAEFLWFIDPLDGTTNYLHGIPQFSVSIAMREHNKLQIGVVYDPLKEELFCASKF